jgi:hypothetical protein
MCVYRICIRAAFAMSRVYCYKCRLRNIYTLVADTYSILPKVKAQQGIILALIQLSSINYAVSPLFTIKSRDMQGFTNNVYGLY